MEAAYELGKESSQKDLKRKISLQTSRGQEEALGNLWYGNGCDIARFMDVVEDSRNGKELERNLGKLDLLRKFRLDQETDAMIRLRSQDTLGNVSYLTVTK